MWTATAESTAKNTDAIYLISAAGATPLTVAIAVHTPLGLPWVGDSPYLPESGAGAGLGGRAGPAVVTRPPEVPLATAHRAVRGPPPAAGAAGMGLGRRARTRRRPPSPAAC